ncbi:MAG: UMP kinase [Methanomethylovorans sp.]|uniref:UMP kinase n=1 Tax=Methanomethylovorans sp. TaxID=2758717 RepID=UPI003C707C9A
MLIALSVGGSILAKDLSTEGFLAYAGMLKELSKEHKLIVVVGGGVAARDYIRTARNLGANEAESDYIGISITRLNAQLLITALGEDAYPVPPLDYKEAQRALSSGKIVVMGGVIPGQTTDAVTAIVAEYIKADLIVIATSVDGVYSADPKKDPNAIKYETLTPKELVKIVISTEMKAGSQSPVDLLAVKIIERSNIKTIVMHGADPMKVADVIMRENMGSMPSKKIPLGTRIVG